MLLAQEGGELQCDVNIVIEVGAAIRENTFKLGITKSLSQRFQKANIETP